MGRMAGAVDVGGGSGTHSGYEDFLRFGSGGIAAALLAPANVRHGSAVSLAHALLR